MNKKEFLIAIVLGLAAGATGAGPKAAEEREVFGKWRIGVGAAFNGGLKADLGLRNLPAPAAYSVPATLSKASAEARAAARKYDGGGYISPDGLNNGWTTTNWELPASAYRGDGRFELDNAYQDGVVAGPVSSVCRDDSDDECQFGVSVDLSRELWIHDERDEHRWGVDFAAAFSYFFRRDIYSVDGTVSRNDAVGVGVIRTDVNDPDAMFYYDAGDDSPSGGGMYGHGEAGFNPLAPALGLTPPFLGDPYDVPGGTTPVVSSYGYVASGDYQELEMLFLLRPWYEIKDWWRVYAEAGVGVSWGRFDSSFSGGGISADEDFAQWDCYGAAGLGTAFRYGHWDLGIDFLGRFLRDDLEVDGRYVRGSIERANWGFRVTLCYSF